MKSLTHLRNEVYRKQGFKIGKGTRIWGEIDRHTNYVSIGDYSVLGGGSFIATHCPIKGIDVEKLRVTIENDVWIGYGTCIAPGSVISRRCMVGMGSVVVGTLKSDSIYAGNPAKRIRIRNPIEVVKTRLCVMQGLTGIPSDIPKWDLTERDIVDIFDDLLVNLKIKDFDFLFDKDFCYHILKEDPELPDDIYETIRFLQLNF